VLGLGSSLPNIFAGTIFPEDLYRYDAAGGRTFTASGSALAYFSLDSTTRIAQFDNQNDGGDFGDWQSNPLPSGVAPKVQDAFATPGAHPTLGPAEITALDVVGYNLPGGSSLPRDDEGDAALDVSFPATDAILDSTTSVLKPR
jgi:hypothetical protein